MSWRTTLAGSASGRPVPGPFVDCGAWAVGQPQSAARGSGPASFPPGGPRRRRKILETDLRHRNKKPKTFNFQIADRRSFGGRARIGSSRAACAAGGRLRVTTSNRNAIKVGGPWADRGGAVRSAVRPPRPNRAKSVATSGRGRDT
uniref:Uncharacterized protein n=1 Tax=Ananas comosus var. bracteatus TaxID=296719 RepID=A0A6V7NT65_ANACO|nr:unnamed protein product [Ananas comosus var. bracteatus]